MNRFPIGRWNVKQIGFSCQTPSHNILVSVNICVIKHFSAWYLCVSLPKLFVIQCSIEQQPYRTHRNKEYGVWVLSISIPATVAPCIPQTWGGINWHLQIIRGGYCSPWYISKLLVGVYIYSRSRKTGRCILWGQIIQMLWFLSSSPFEWVSVKSFENLRRLK